MYALFIYAKPAFPSPPLGDPPIPLYSAKCSVQLPNTCPAQRRGERLDNCPGQYFNQLCFVRREQYLKAVNDLQNQLPPKELPSWHRREKVYSPVFFSTLIHLPTLSFHC
jgi:hypothetical protein